eukprot:TRINITY_DN232_c0_g1_i6.p1 TRINITY_DN232_c0_g1~~TRINITY_DN232_c0_g1_i6.p1  ORF type:complete len:756 (+),score=216.09 TRINITY_DN232_c0_g1_i6:134-2269(+)
MGTLVKIILASFLCISCTRAFDVCSTNARWRSVGNRIELDGKEYQVKGANWWGLEDPGIRMLTGLDKASLGTYLNFLTTNNFNSIRIPLSVDWVLHPERVVQPWSVSAEPALVGKTSFQVLDHIFLEAQKRGLSILLDFHWFITFNEGQLGLWYSKGNCQPNPEGECRQFTEQDVMNAWSTLVGRLKTYSNFMGVDFINEAYSTTWGTNIATDWDGYVNRQAADILSRHPDFKGLFWIEGIADAPNPAGCNFQQTPGHWWGGNLEFVQCKPLTVPADRLVWAPHTYGPSLYAQSYFNDPSFPNNMPAIWNAHFGYLASTQPVVISEWGGMYQGATKVFQDALARYMASKKMGSFYWALVGRPGEVNTVDGLVTPNNGGTLTVIPGKLPMLAIATPSPAVVRFTATCTPSSDSVTSAATSTQAATVATTAAVTSSATVASVTSATTGAPPVVTSTTGAGSTTGTAPCTIGVRQTFTNSWQANGATVSQYSSTVANNGGQAVTLKFKFTGGALVEYWSLTANSDGTFGLPSWMTTLAPGASFDFGYSTSASAPLTLSFITPSCNNPSVAAVATTAAVSSTAAVTTAAATAAVTTATAAATSAVTSSSSSTTAVNSGCRLSISQKQTNSWKEGPTTMTQFDVTVTNTGASPLRSLELSTLQVSSISQIWNVQTMANGNYGMPSWLNGNLGAGASFTFGYVIRSASSTTFATVNC